MRAGWVTQKLSEIVYIQEGPGIRKHEYEADGYPMINVRCVQNGYIDMSNSRSANMELATTKWEHFQVKAQDILFTISGTIGRSAIVQEGDLPLLMNTSVVRFRPLDPKLDTRFLYHLVSSSHFINELLDYATGTAIKNVGPSHLKKMEISYPPLSEQKRIVAILDQAFEAIDQAQANIERNIKNAEELFQSKLNEVFSQEVDGWEEKKLIELTDKIGSGATPRGGQSSYKDSGISLIRSMNVHNEGFRMKNLAFIDEEQAAKLDNVKVESDDVLLNITGASVARCCVVESDILPARVNQHVSIIRPNRGRINSQFLHYALTCQENKKKLLGIGEQGATRQAITKAQIQAFKISFPRSIEAQERIVIEINETRKMTGRIIDILSQKIASIEELKKSLLQKAFSGELTVKEVVA